MLDLDVRDDTLVLDLVVLATLVALVVFQYLPDVTVLTVLVVAGSMTSELLVIGSKNDTI